MKASTIEELTDNLHKILTEAETLLQGSADSAGNTFDEAAATARDSLRRTCTHLRNARDEITNRARTVDHAVHAHPWQALAGTAIVAFIAGLAVRRR